MYDQIKPICEALRIVLEQIEKVIIAISFVCHRKSNEAVSQVELNQLKATFMYTTFIKRIL